MFAFLKKRTRSTLGIDIGRSSIKILEISKINHQYRIEQYGKIDIPEYVFDVNTLASCLDVLFSNTKFSSKQAVIAIPDSHATCNTIFINANTLKRDREAWIGMEMEKCCPYPTQPFYFDFHVVGRAKHDSNQLEIRVVASSIESVQIRAEALHRVGLNPKAVEIESYAIERVKRLWNTVDHPFDSMLFATQELQNTVQRDALELNIACGLAIR